MPNATLETAAGRGVDLSRPFVCETLSPLYYTATYSRLSPAQKLRYNQIFGMYCNEVICFLEEVIAPNTLSALRRGGKRLPPELRERLAAFQAEEEQHTEMFRDLNRRSAPEWYSGGDHRLFAVPRAWLGAFAWMARRCEALPFMLWIMLSMEEKSIVISRRCLRRGDGIDPLYREIYRSHLREEATHVQIDRQLIECLYETRSLTWRRANAVFYRWLMGGFFTVPGRSAIRVLDVLLDEFPELRPLRVQAVRELRGLADDPAYHETLFSRAETPVLFALFDRCPELHSMRQTLLAYRPS